MKSFILKQHRRSWILVTLLFWGALLIPAVLWGEAKRAGAEGAVLAPVKDPSGEPKRPAKAAVDFRRLIGQWKRADGNYVIVIRSIDPDGRLEAAYYNPRPIDISLAEAFREGDTARVYIVLWDMGYPGTTYQLTYLPQKDVLLGIYYPLAAGKKFEVVFTRSR